MGCINSSPSNVIDDLNNIATVANDVSNVANGISNVANDVVTVVNGISNVVQIVSKDIPLPPTIKRTPTIKRSVSIVVKNDMPDMQDEEIPLSKSGDHYTIFGTKVVVNIDTCKVIGYLKDGIFQSDNNEYVQSVCKQFQIEFEN